MAAYSASGLGMQKFDTCGHGKPHYGSFLTKTQYQDIPRKHVGRGLSLDGFLLNYLKISLVLFKPDLCRPPRQLIKVVEFKVG